MPLHGLHWVHVDAHPDLLLPPHLSPEAALDPDQRRRWTDFAKLRYAQFIEQAGSRLARILPTKITSRLATTPPAKTTALTFQLATVPLLPA